MCTLWQRLGRAVRHLGLKGVGLVFVEARYFDSEKNKPPDGQAKKRKASKPKATSEGSSKRARVGASETQPNVVVLAPSINTVMTRDVSEGREDGPEASMLKDIQASRTPESDLLDEHTTAVPSEMTQKEKEETLRALYKESQKKSQTKAVVKKKIQELDPELQDFVNAKGRDLRCRRAPIRLYFNSDQTGKSHAFLIRKLLDGQTNAHRVRPSTV